jgi:hypothetical protein
LHATRHARHRCFRRQRLSDGALAGNARRTLPGVSLNAAGADRVRELRAARCTGHRGSGVLVGGARAPGRGAAPDHRGTHRERAHRRRGGGAVARARAAGAGGPGRVRREQAGRPAPRPRPLYRLAIPRGLRYAEATADDVLIVSALHHLIALSEQVRAYDRNLGAARKVERLAWGVRVVGLLSARYPGQAIELTCTPARPTTTRLRRPCHGGLRRRGRGTRPSPGSPSVGGLRGSRRRGWRTRSACWRRRRGIEPACATLGAS